MFELDRTFCQLNTKTGLREWFFSAREGLYGPFPSKEKAEMELKKFIQFNVVNASDGGRNPKSNAKLSLVPLSSMNAIKLNDTKGKRGDDD